MDDNQNSDKQCLNERIAKFLKNFLHCKQEAIKTEEERNAIRENFSRLELEYKEISELEESNRQHLSNSREMISNLQKTISHLVYLKRDIKACKEEISLKESIINNKEKEKETILLQNSESIQRLREAFEKQIEDLKESTEYKVQQIQRSSETETAQLKCEIEQLKNKLIELDQLNNEKMNKMELEYEEKLQRSSALVSQLQDQMARQAALADATVDAHRKRAEEMEQKYKQTQFKQYLAQNYDSQLEDKVEKPYSVDGDSFHEPRVVPMTSGHNFPALQSPSRYNYNKNKALGKLQVAYYNSKITNNHKVDEDKNEFRITKKRKLYNKKDFEDL